MLQRRWVREILAGGLLVLLVLPQLLSLQGLPAPLVAQLDQIARLNRLLPWKAAALLATGLDGWEALAVLGRVAAADALVLASHEEGFPNAVIEAMAAGCCIVGSDTAPVRETIDDGVHGLLADMRAPASLADRIATALDDAGLRSRLARAARDRAVARYALSDRLPEHRALVHAVAARHGNGLKRFST
jgi:glycosyltransferase involved in cell wall biosynthesis